LRVEISLDKRFGVLSAHLKRLPGGRTETDTTTRAIEERTGLSELWVFDAISGRTAETIYGQHGANLIDKMGGVEIPAHIGNKICQRERLGVACSPRESATSHVRGPREMSYLLSGP
jgi:hypothetical protein